MTNNQTCMCGRRDPVNGATCDICGIFFCGACATIEMETKIETEIDILDITVCTECNHPEVIDEHILYKEVATMQEMINSGLAWTLEGSVGRRAMDLIEAGLCILGPERTIGSYGNIVPSRFDVKPGTKGSLEFQEAMRE